MQRMFLIFFFIEPKQIELIPLKAADYFVQKHKILLNNGKCGEYKRFSFILKVKVLILKSSRFHSIAIPYIIRSCFLY